MKIELYQDNWADTKHIVALSMAAMTDGNFVGCAEIKIKFLYGDTLEVRTISFKVPGEGECVFKKLLTAWRAKR